jgi:hypothetical protein
MAYHEALLASERILASLRFHSALASDPPTPFSPTAPGPLRTTEEG